MKKLILQEKLKTSLQKHPGRIALECRERQLTYSQLDRDSTCICRRVRALRVPKGGLVGIYMADRSDFILFMIGILRAGCLVVPLDTSFSSKRTETELRLTGTGFVLCDSILNPALARITGEMESPPRIIPVDGSFSLEDDPSFPDECTLEYHGEDFVLIDFKPGPGGTLTAPVLTNKGLSHLIDREIEILDMDYTSRVAQQASSGTGTFLMEVLPALCSGAVVCIRPTVNKRAGTPVVFMFAGLGSQYVDMGLDLYRSEPLFRLEMDRCFEILGPLTDFDIKELLFSSPKALDRIEVAQAVIFVIEYALAKLLMNWGITPRAMIGYSFGEYTAACLSGVFSLEDALKLIVGRGQLLRELPAGAMTSVPLPEEQLRPLLEAALSIAINNGPSCIVAGPEEAVHRFETELKKKKLLTMRLKASRAVHSEMMAPILEKFEKIVRRVSLNKPRFPFMSNVSGDWITEAEAVDPNYWVKQLREPVQFARGLTRLLEGPPSVFVEIGPGADLSALMRYFTNGKPGHKTVTTMRNPGKEVPDTDFLLTCISRLQRWGVSVDVPIPVPDPELTRWLHNSHIGRLICKPDIFDRFTCEALRSENFPCLTHVLLYGGDIAPQGLGEWYRVFGSRIQLINAYGAAETTMVKAVYFIQPGDARQETLPIGKPVKGARLIILNKVMNICGNGIAGEIYIRTPYRANYYNNPRLNRERFIPNPFGRDPNDLIYRTGDSGKLLPDGNIVLTGRPRPAIVGGRKTVDPVEYVPPGNETEEKLAAMWCKILKKEPVGILDDFFESGGHSLGIMMLAAEIYKTFKVEMTVPQLFNKPRIKEISAYITGAGPGYGDEPFVVFNEDKPVKLFLFPPRVAYGLDYKGLALQLTDYSFYAFNYIDGGGVGDYVDLIEKIQPGGPYILLGYSAGGNLAFEVAGEIERRGCNVRALILLDVYANREAAGIADLKMQEKYLNYIKTNMEAMGLSFLKDRVMRKMESYAYFLEGLEHRGVLEAEFHLITGIDRKMHGDWDQFTSNGCKVYDGFGKHIEMLNPH
ncbi:MAG: acyltransferase domain-containing protein, partial [bacterium]|nr:acyltransferase domain-containing protein [bacterium]